jgi:hypothetical protein
VEIKVDASVILTDYDDCTGESEVWKSIIAEAARQITTGHTGAQRQYQEELNRQIKEEVGVVVKRVMEEPIQMTNSWGEPSGKPTTMRDLIIGTARAWLEERVGNDGRKAAFSHDNDVPRAQWLARDAASTVLKDYYQQAQAEVKTLVGAKLSGTITDAVAKVLGIKDAA